MKALDFAAREAQTPPQGTGAMLDPATASAVLWALRDATPAQIKAAHDLVDELDELVLAPARPAEFWTVMVDALIRTMTLCEMCMSA